MIAVLGILAGLALVSAGFGMLELAQTWTRDATVFQQISARVDVGLSLLVFATAGGFAAILAKMDALATATRQHNNPPHALAAIPTTAPATSATSTMTERPEAGVHRGVSFFLIGEDYRATVNGVEVTGSTPDIIRVRISRVMDDTKSV